MKRLLISFSLVFLALAVVWSILPEPWRRQVSTRLGWKSFIANEAGTQQYDNQDYSMALNKWGEALAQSHNRPDLLYNLSLGLQLLQKPDDAKKSYQTLIGDSQTPEAIKYFSHFNRGVIAHTDKNVDEALTDYQAALDLNPDSVETKTNIELLLAGGQGKGKGKSDEGKGDQQDDQQKDGEGDKDKKDQPKEYAKNKPQPQKFKGDKLDQSDVNKILGEIRQQEQKIRSEYNKREAKESPRDKDW